MFTAETYTMVHSYFVPLKLLRFLKCFSEFGSRYDVLAFKSRSMAFLLRLDHVKSQIEQKNSFTNSIGSVTDMLGLNPFNSLR